MRSRTHPSRRPDRPSPSDEQVGPLAELASGAVTPPEYSMTFPFSDRIATAPAR